MLSRSHPKTKSQDIVSAVPLLSSYHLHLDTNLLILKMESHGHQVTEPHPCLRPRTPSCLLKLGK